LAAAAALWPLLVLAEFKPWLLLSEDSLRPALRFLADFFPPRVDAEFLSLVARETWRTVAIATAGLALGLLAAVPLALLAARTLSLSALTGRMARGPWALRWVARTVLVVLRSVPELIWALVFVRVVGLGPTAGVLAIALTYAGMLGKVYAEILESGDSHAAQALMRNGTGRLQAFFYGLLPQNAAELTSYTVYRWECAIRSSAGPADGQLNENVQRRRGGHLAARLRGAGGVDGPPERLAAAGAGMKRCTACWLLVGLLALVVASFVSLDLQWSRFFSADALRRMGRFLAELLAPSTDPRFIAKLLPAMLETLAMSVVGTLLAAVFGLLLALPAARTHADDPARGRSLTRLVLNALRSVPELMWAALLLISAGLGPMAGTLALALHTTGVLGRLFAEAIENAPDGPAFALRVRGVGEGRLLLYATLPQLLPQLVSYTLYRWENNIRAAAVLGVVGAGGLGQMLAFHLGLFQMPETSAVLAAMLLQVLAVDAASVAARWAMAR
jgi:phosphonate transport system permease protein